MDGIANGALALLRRTADPAVVAAIEALLGAPEEHRLNRINVLAFAARHGFSEEKTIAAFLHAARAGLFDLTWNVLCPGCGGVLNSNVSLKFLDSAEYHCRLCACGYEPTLDEMVEVTFTVNPRVRRIAAHAPERLPFHEYVGQIFWASGVDLREDFAAALDRILLESIELPAGERAVLAVTMPRQFLIVFDPVTHATQFIDVAGEPTEERQNLTFVIDDRSATTETVSLRPGPLRLAVENHSAHRALPGIWIANDEMHDLLGRRRPFLTAKRLLSNQVFRDLYRADTLGLEQRLKITSLTFLFTDLKGSTELYERIGDLAAFDLVRAHFGVLQDVVAEEAGAVVKTIGDAVMATFPSPARAVAAALRMREAMQRFNAEHDLASGGLLLKIALHEGPCLAVTLNDRQDFFGQTVNIAARVQELAMADAILATREIVEDAEAANLLASGGIRSEAKSRALRGVAEEYLLYELSPEREAAAAR